MKKIDKINKKLEEYKKECRRFSLIEESYSIEKLLKEIKHLHFQENYPMIKMNYISKEHTIILMKHFLNECVPTFLPLFESLLKNNHIYWCKSKPSIHKAGYHGKIPFIKLTLSYTLQDFITLVHEFFHLTNRKFEQTTYQITRETLSEFISIYFEKTALTFLEVKGYSKKEITYLKAKRIKDTHHTIKRYHYEKKIWKVYTENGLITVKNTPYKIEKINEYFEKYTFSPFKKMVYILGDILSEYVSFQNISINTILNLNSSLNEFSIFMAFDTLGITLDSSKIKEIIIVYQNHIDKTIMTFS